MKNSLVSLTFGLLIISSSAQTMAATSARDFTPPSDASVVERLPERVRRTTATATTTPAINNPAVAAEAARQLIRTARSSADPRYLGRAQAQLASWWNKPDAPADIAILQATIEQSRHEFDAARNTLERALQRDPKQAQGWLTLATIERVAARYDAASAACAQVGRVGAALYAQACLAETRSLQGQFDAARKNLRALIAQASDAPTQAWLWSLLAESEERAGVDAQARDAFERSLALADDGYTALAFADFLLRTNNPAAAQKTLSNQPLSDAVLVRVTTAQKRLNDPRWQASWRDLQNRFADIQARGENSNLHARETALALLWIEGDAGKAFIAAKENLAVQKEPLDWWLCCTQQASPAATMRCCACNRCGLKLGFRTRALTSNPVRRHELAHKLAHELAAGAQRFRGLYLLLARARRCAQSKRRVFVPERIRVG